MRDLSDEVLGFLAKEVGDSMALVGVGGIMTAGDLLRKRELGAQLYQLYTGWVYGGPWFPNRLLKALISRPDQAAS